MMILNLQFLILVFGIHLSKGSYKGESFPVQYLKAETLPPTISDVEYYLQGLSKIVSRLEQVANETDVNRGLGLFYMKAILKRTIKENKNKIEEDQLKTIKKIISQGANILSHIFWLYRRRSFTDLDKRVVELLKDDELQTQEIGRYNKNRLQKFILGDNSLNNLSQVMDELKLKREEYLKLTEDAIYDDEYSLNVDDSDYCIGEVLYNPMPLDKQTFKPCVTEYCSELVYEPKLSVSYSLSHRMLNVMFPRNVRLCYMKSQAEDSKLLDILCASMYREVVFIARLGYFSRDVFMEHIALCSLLGYEEFHRRHWFRKVMSWIDDAGCLPENLNYEINRTRYKVEHMEDEERAEVMEKAKRNFEDNCHWHPMALGVIVLAHGVRHAVHFREIDGEVKDEL